MDGGAREKAQLATFKALVKQANIQNRRRGNSVSSAADTSNFERNVRPCVSMQTVYIVNAF